MFLSVLKGPAAYHKAFRMERAARPGTGLFKGVWGRCHQQAEMDFPPQAGRTFSQVLIHLPCLPRSCPGFSLSRLPGA